MEILKIGIPKWNIAEITGYDPMTTFWQDFSMADKFGNEAIADTYRKVKAEWKDNYKHWTELCLVLNHKIWIVEFLIDYFIFGFIKHIVIYCLIQNSKCWRYS